MVFFITLVMAIMLIGANQILKHFPNETDFILSLSILISFIMGMLSVILNDRVSIKDQS